MVLVVWIYTEFVFGCEDNFLVKPYAEPGTS